MSKPVIPEMGLDALKELKITLSQTASDLINKETVTDEDVSTARELRASIDAVDIAISNFSNKQALVDILGADNPVALSVEDPTLATDSTLTVEDVKDSVDALIDAVINVVTAVTDLEMEEAAEGESDEVQEDDPELMAVETIEVLAVEVPVVLVVETTEVLAVETTEVLVVETTEVLAVEEVPVVVAVETTATEVVATEVLAVETTATEVVATEVLATVETTEILATTEVLAIETTEVLTVNEEVSKIENKELSMTIEGAAKAPVVIVPKIETSSVTAASGAPGKRPGDAFGNMNEVALEVLDAYQRAGGTKGWNVPADTYSTVAIASIATNKEMHVVTPDAERNFTILKNAVDDFEASRTEALVASGGICAPFETDYSFYRLAVPQSPMENSIPVARAPRGGIRFIVPTDYRAARNGVGTVTCAQDAAGYVSTPANCGGPGPTADKPCVCVSCPTVAECCVSAVSTCVRWGNFNYFTFPEQVESFMQDLMVNFAIVKESMYLNSINAASTAVTSAKVYGATRDLLGDWRRAAVGYRHRNRMPRDAVLEIDIPSFALDLIKQDMTSDYALGLSYLSVTDEQVMAAVRALNLRPTWYVDSATGLGQAMDAVQAAGPLNSYPATVVVYMYAPGSFVRLDGGNLDLGIVRDSQLNRTNDLQMFAEQFTGLCFRGIESIKLTSTTCADGSAPAGVVPACA